MKKRMLVLVMILCMVLSGCSAAETFEQLKDVYASAPPAEVREISLTLPEDAALSVMSTDAVRMYLGESYEVLTETMESGDLNKTLRKITGYSTEQLTIMELKDVDFNRYLCAWSTVTEEGEKVGRCAVLDDGNYHYCLTVLVPAAEAGRLQKVIDSILTSYTLSS